MKRNIGMICLFISMLCLLTACSSGTTGKSALDPKNPVSITLWHYYMGDNKIALERAVDQFNKSVGSEKGVVVTAVAKGSISELEKAVTDSAKGVINSEPMPDLFSCYPDKAIEIDQLGKLAKLNDYFSESEQNLYVSEFLKEGIFDDNRLVSIPIVKSTELLYINTTSLNAFLTDTGFTQDKLKTWEGIYESARAYYQWTDAQTPETLWDGKSFMGFDSVANFIVIGNKQLGVEVIDGKDKQAVLNRTSLKKVFDLYYQGFSLGYFNAVGKFRSDDIKAGDLIAYVGSSSGAAYFPAWIEKDNTQSSIEFSPMLYPVFENGTPFAIQQGAGMCIAQSTPEHQEGSALFLKWFTDPKQNIQFAMTTGYLPVQTSAYENSEFQTALETMKSGEAADQNVAKVYEIALNQITQSNTYSATPFQGSYDVRSILEKSLLSMAESGRQNANTMKEQGMTEEDILQALDTNARFEEWLASVRTQFDKLGIAYTVE